MTASQRSATSRRRSAGAGLVNVGLAVRSHAALGQLGPELVEQHVAARLADVEQGDGLRQAAGAGRQRAVERLALARGVEQL